MGGGGGSIAGINPSAGIQILFIDTLRESEFTLGCIDFVHLRNTVGDSC
jgi:hypothetical protein